MNHQAEPCRVVNGAVARAAWRGYALVSAVLLAYLSPAVGQLDATTIDYADPAESGQWLRHPVCGDLSYDSFVHSAVNPVLRGVAPYEWPVNGFLFRDPVGGGWYLYVGHYRANYAIDSKAPMRCTVLRSLDKGRTWQDLGPVFAGEPPTYAGEVSPTAHIPDVSVIYADGRYHMCFDWLTQNGAWENAHTPPAGVNSGVGYAWSERPEGPFHITARPVASTREQPLLLGKYRRLYISTIVRRARDWLVLTDTDSGPCFGWAMVGMTAERPEGPYHPAKMLLNPESTRFHPPLLEFNPAFTHEGFIYMPATSVAGNRNYQVIFRSPIEKAMDPEAWVIWRCGTLWHSDPVEHETYGIWGQTFSGFIGPDGLFSVFFPSRDSKGMGTVNLASRPWNEPMRSRGFVVSGQQAANLCYLKKGGPFSRVEGDLDRTGTVSLLWNAEGVLGAAAIQHPFVIHSLGLCSHVAIEFAPRAWSLIEVDRSGKRRLIGSGLLPAGPTCQFALAWRDARIAELALSGKVIWRGEVPTGPGCVGILCQPGSRAEVRKLAITAPQASTRIRYLCTDAILGAARKASDWPLREDKGFRYGVGAVSTGTAVEAKWNFEGTAFSLWAPKSPGFGRADLIVDGRHAATIDFSSDGEMPSQPIYQMKDLPPDAGHALILRTAGQPVPLDVLEVVP